MIFLGSPLGQRGCARIVHRESCLALPLGAGRRASGGRKTRKEYLELDISACPENLARSQAQCEIEMLALGPRGDVRLLKG